MLIYFFLTWLRWVLWCIVRGLFVGLLWEVLLHTVVLFCFLFVQLREELRKFIKKKKNLFHVVYRDWPWLYKSTYLRVSEFFFIFFSLASLFSSFSPTPSIFSLTPPPGHRHLFSSSPATPSPFSPPRTPSPFSTPPTPSLFLLFPSTLSLPPPADSVTFFFFRLLSPPSFVSFFSFSSPICLHFFSTPMHRYFHWKQIIWKSFEFAFSSGRGFFTAYCAFSIIA